jgi:hypothetical protein
MRCALALFAISTTFVAGCASAPKPPPGSSSLQVEVRAEPKPGVAKLNSGGGGVELGYGPDAAADTGPLSRIDYSDVEDIVVWLEPLDGQKVMSAPSIIEIDVSKRRDHVLIAPVGGTLRCVNPSARLLRAYLRGEGMFVDLGTIPAGGQTPFTFKSRGAFDIATDAADDPVATIFVAPAEWVQVGRSKHSITFNPLPPGRYKVACWHTRLPGSEQVVTLAPDSAAKATVTVTVNQLPKVP